MTTLGLSGNKFGQTTGAVECIAEGLGSNSMLLKLDLSSCALGDGGVSTLAQTLGSRNTTLQKLSLGVSTLAQTLGSRNNIRLQKLKLASNAITSTGLGVLLGSMEQNSHLITDLPPAQSYWERGSKTPS
jgi:hypothetical protein